MPLSKTLPGFQDGLGSAGVGFLRQKTFGVTLLRTQKVSEKCFSFLKTFQFMLHVILLQKLIITYENADLA